MSQTKTINIPKEPLRVPSLEVMLNGARCTIFGIHHDEKASDGELSPYYQQLFTEEVDRDLENDQAPLWLGEQYSAVCLPEEVSPCEMTDQAVGMGGFYFKNGFRTGAYFQLVLAPLPFYVVRHYLTKYCRSRTEAPQEELPAEVLQELELTERERKRTELEAGFLEALSKAERTVTGDLKPSHQKALNTDLVRLRSLYQAEFIRHYFPGEDKKVVVGALHVRQIVSFLQHPGENPIPELSQRKYQKISDLAKMHAELAQEEDSSKYAKIAYQVTRKNLNLETLGQAASIAPWLPWLSAVGMAFYYACSG